MNDLVRLYRWAQIEANILVDRDTLSPTGIASQQARIESGKFVLAILEGNNE